MTAMAATAGSTTIELLMAESFRSSWGHTTAAMIGSNRVFPRLPAVLVIAQTFPSGHVLLVSIVFLIRCLFAPVRGPLYTGVGRHSSPKFVHYVGAQIMSGSTFSAAAQAKIAAAFEESGLLASATHGQCVAKCQEAYQRCGQAGNLCRIALEQCINNCPNTMALNKDDVKRLIDKLAAIPD